MEHEATCTWLLRIPSKHSVSFESEKFTAPTNEGYKWYLEAMLVERNEHEETYLLFLCLNSANELMPTIGKCQFFVRYFSSLLRDPELLRLGGIRFTRTIDNFGNTSDSNQKWSLKCYLSRNRRKSIIYRIHFEMSFSTTNPIANPSFDASLSSFPTSTVSSDLIEPELNSSEFRIIDDFKQLLKNGEFADIVISVKDKDFKAHRAVLIARSPVFAAMFRHEIMEENQQDKIVIKDLDEQVVEEMLNYIYTGKSENLEEQADGLLVAGDKYGLDELKDLSEKAIIENLSIDNVIDALKLADLHCAFKLKSHAINLIVSRSAEVMKTPAWKTMASSRPQLSVEVCEAFSRLVESKLCSK